MDWSAIQEVAKTIFDYGFMVVWSAIGIVIVVGAALWYKRRQDRKLDREELRQDAAFAAEQKRQEQIAAAVVKQTEVSEKASEGIQVIAKQTERQTEFMERMDQRLDGYGRRLDEHGTALTRILEHLFGEGKRE